MRSGSTVSRESGVGAGVGCTGAGVSGAGCTTPICLGPGGAATRLTLYIGAIGGRSGVRTTTSAATINACSTTDIAIGPRSDTDSAATTAALIVAPRAP